METGNKDVTKRGSIEWRRKISASRKGQRIQEQTKRKMSLAQKGKWKHTEESKKKIGESHRGKIISEAQRQKQREKMLGRKRDLATVQQIATKLRGRSRPRYIIEKLRLANLGKPLSEEHRRKLSEIKKGKPKKEEHVARGEQCGRAILNEDSVIEIVIHYYGQSSGLSHRKLAQLYGVEKSAVTCILTGLSWVHLWGHYPTYIVQILKEKRSRRLKE